jgi:5-methylcytosine-specific restriction protein A
MHTTDKRIRGRRLQAIRTAHFAMHPLCVHCLAKGKVREAQHLDHIKALHNGGKDEPSNRQGLCIPCHDIKTKLDLGYRVREQIGPDGEPVG